MRWLARRRAAHLAEYRRVYEFLYLMKGQNQ